MTRYTRGKIKLITSWALATPTEHADDVKIVLEYTEPDSCSWGYVVEEDQFGTRRVYA